MRPEGRGYFICGRIQGEKKKDRTFGDEKLSLGKTASYWRMHSRIRLSSSENA